MNHEHHGTFGPLSGIIRHLILSESDLLGQRMVRRWRASDHPLAEKGDWDSTKDPQPFPPVAWVLRTAIPDSLGQQGGRAMFAHVSDRLVIASSQVGGTDRTGEVVDVRCPNGKPPYLIQWDHDGRETLVSPGPQAYFVCRSSRII